MIVVGTKLYGRSTLRDLNFEAVLVGTTYLGRYIQHVHIGTGDSIMVEASFSGPPALHFFNRRNG